METFPSNAQATIIGKNKLQEAAIEAAIEAAMKKIWQRERANGETSLSFDEWLYSGKNEGGENK